MKLISHRGNVEGFTHEENSFDAINNALSLGFDVEVDVWFKDGFFWLGHDFAKTRLTEEDLSNLLRDERVWIHCKNLNCLMMIARKNRETPVACDFFFHCVDDAVLTNRGLIWAHIHQRPGKSSVYVLPEQSKGSFDDAIQNEAWAICTDRPKTFKETIKNLEMIKQIPQETKKKVKKND